MSQHGNLDDTGGERPPGRQLPTIRARWLIVATALAVAGVASVAVAVTSQHHAPQPSRSAQAAPLPTTASTTSAPTTHATTTRPAATSTVVPKPTVPPSTTPPLPPVQSGLSLAASQPVTLTIPAISVQTSIMNLGLNADSTVQTPPLSRNSVAGWYEFSPSPGATGSSVMLGHVDSAAYGPGVFFRLGSLNPGNEVDVTRADGSVAVFRVDRVAEYPKSAFPTQLVYGATSYASLKLVTCGGSFDSSTRNYRDNIIAFASLIATRRA